ncbi:hypothetical protein ACSQ67_012484 [Phaseolus vulgaris]
MCGFCFLYCMICHRSPSNLRKDYSLLVCDLGLAVEKLPTAVAGYKMIMLFFSLKYLKESPLSLPMGWEWDFVLVVVEFFLL